MNSTLQNVADVIVALVTSPLKFDLNTYSTCAEAEMERTRVYFKKYMDVFDANDEAYKQVDFDETDVYFWHVINDFASEHTIYRMVELCMEVR